MPIIAIKRPTPEQCIARILEGIRDWAQDYSRHFLAGECAHSYWALCSGSSRGRIVSFGGHPVSPVEEESREDRLKRLFAQKLKEDANIAVATTEGDFSALQSLIEGNLS